MGQKASHQGGSINEKKLPISLFPLKLHTTSHRHSEQSVKFQYKNKRKNDAKQTNCVKQNIVNSQNIQLNNLNKSNQSKHTNECRLVKTQNAPTVGRAKSEPSLVPVKRREKYTRHRRKSTKIKNNWDEDIEQFGYDIQDVDAFLAKATIEEPANIPVVLAFPSVLYQTRIGGYQAEIWLPLGMVVNAVFKNQHWLYVQTPHAEEGYVSYAACLPLGIIPSSDDDNKPAPCWEKSTDVFPKPSGNMTDTEKLSSKSDCEDSGRCRIRSRNVASSCGERSVDQLYLRATAILKSKGKDEGIRQTLLVIETDFLGTAPNDFSAVQGEVVFLLHANVRGWFYVRNKEGREGYIPAAVAGHGFL
ncbi:unnamed protein product [Phaedon cochleariae]|uniref:SH3 domain-containing protein n=1 Tax=Phaedon cochleariae TaxID=80249 RepID=A0A9P0DGH7_PHACE|nr:unnamed protein product [Phaedon cochleariae]